MNPLLFADWGRMNRLFTKLMWTVAGILVCIVFAVATSSGHPARAASPHAAAAAGAPGVAAASRTAARPSP